MTARRKKIAALLIVVGLIAALALISGCGSQTKTAAGNTNSTCPTTVPQTTTPQASSTQPQSTTPPASTAPSASKQAVEQAKAEGKPVLFCFHSLKCAPCIEIEKNINQVKPEFEGKVAFVVLDVYDQSEYNFAMENGIQTIPTTFFIGKDGNIVNKQVGVMTPEQLRQQLNTML
jgi:thioredoxin-like negative regulator of GroEL